ncbi:MAG: DUF599 domain-containing protein [Hyphomicrobium zavarzinii]|jgi:uncharacterized membrane protein|uniref:DUF599 domain-containing protein n=1 Tax=Hyphomicrobium TaxID=81 RepID=UPI00036DA911|nr:MULTISPECIES: DUF599 domain-containing protein [Hyphomicrobium]MBL8844271.1 DUF599 domain-containing protein [Hyphomicrobium zavarzinii]WBT36919.1 DUF599 domain-containing protein [Hyphomicrobium sp. DMF-1]HML41987.1 DUF599 domain-containing protein [Hyphomicrobium zavarzinii]
MMTGITLYDVVAFTTFLVCWPGYHWAARHVDARRPSLMSLVKKFRHQWIERIGQRESHVADATLLGNLLRGALFFASTTVLILGGLLALLGTASKVAELTSHLPFVRSSDPALAELKALILILVFVYAFFKFTWSAWQYNVLSILVGAMPDRDHDGPQRKTYIAAAGDVAALAGEAYNNGVRAYYFSIPLMAWLVDPLLFLGATLLVTLVLYRREFSSPVMDALKSVQRQAASE